MFDRDSDPPVGALKKVLAGRRFDLALTLHEDYDANGLYLYEISEQRMDDLGETLLAAARALGFPIDARGTVDTRRFTKPGSARRRQRTALAKSDIHPEAIWLYLNRTRQSLTIETPSEFSLAARARMQARLIEVCVERLFINRRRWLLPLSRSHPEKLRAAQGADGRSTPAPSNVLRLKRTMSPLRHCRFAVDLSRLRCSRLRGGALSFVSP